jgi:glycerophosphoryl diester phosphodiesterase
MKTLVLTIFLGTFLSLNLAAQRTSKSAKSVVKGVTAHRGHSTAFPENTLSAFQAGIDAGADWVELDIFKTKDGKIVVFHDRTTGRITENKLVIADTSYEELSQLDVATDFRKRQALTIEQCPVQRMPLLSEAIELIMKQKRTRLSIQPKADIVDAAIAIVKTARAEKMVGFNDGNLKYMSDVKHLNSRIPVFWDRPADSDIDEDIRVAKERGFESLVINSKGITPEKVQKVKAAGLEIGAWTVNAREEMDTLLKMGIERIYTDDPDLLIEVKNAFKKN